MRETVEINGVSYDAKTGLPVGPEKPKLDTPAKKTQKISKPKKVVVQTPKKIIVSEAKKPVKAVRKPAPSRTLNRRFVQKPPVKVVKTAKPVTSKPSVKPIKIPIPKPTVSVRPSPITPRGIRRPAPTPTQPKSAEEEPIIENTRSAKITSAIVSSIIAGLIIIGFLVYFFVPSVSFWVASSRAEVNASMPTYAPTGYNIEGRAQASSGVVTVNYKSANDSVYSISMANSNWDSQGVLENKVKPESLSYQTLNQKGLTIFVLDNDAMWVNGGVLYTISFDSYLSNDEILKIVDGI